MGTTRDDMPQFDAPIEPDEPIAARLAAAEADAAGAGVGAELGAGVEADAETAPVGPDSAADAEALPTPPQARTARALGLLRAPRVAFAAGLVVVVACALAVPVAQSAAATADEEAVAALVADYAIAVEDGDVATATELAPLDGDEASTATLDATQVAGPSVDLGEPRIGDGEATVSATVQVQGQTAETQLRLERGDDGWSITRGLAVPTLLGQPGTVDAVGGAAVPDIDDGDAVWLYPGVYEVVPTTSPYLDAGGVTVPVLPAFASFGMTTIWLAFDPGPQLQADAVDEAVAFVGRCASQWVAGCPPVAAAGTDTTFEAHGATLRFESSTLMRYELLVQRLDAGVETDVVTVDVVVAFSDDLQSATFIPIASTSAGQELVEP